MGLPFDPGAIAGDALDVLAQRLELSDPGSPGTHVALVAVDVEHEEVPEALGAYLVAVVAGGVELDCELSNDLLDEDPAAATELRAYLRALLGDSNSFPTDEDKKLRDRVRNPWITEVLGHALLLIHAHHGGLCLLGDVAALKLPHVDPRRAGLDLLAIYSDDGHPAAAIGEVKASRRYGRRRLDDAVTFFADVDAGGRSTELRIDLKALKPALPDAIRANFADGFWRERRTYLPVVAHCVSIDESNAHDGLNSLKPPKDYRRLIALRIEGFHGFFDAVADAARSEMEGLLA